MKRQTPWHTLVFLGAVFGILGVISYCVPEDGIRLTAGFRLQYPSFASLFPKENPAGKTDISKIIALADAEDKIQEEASKGEKTDSSEVKALETELEKETPAAKLVTSIQYSEGNKTALDRFFYALHHIDEASGPIRVLHYGDSQIEGDRISDYLRQKLQEKFGGGGPGLISLMPIAPSVTNRISWSDNWDRYTMFTGRDKRAKHNNFGVMAQFSRFNAYTAYSDTAAPQSAWIKVVTTQNGGATSRAYTRARLFYGNARQKTYAEFYENGNLLSSDSLDSGGNFHIKTFGLSQAPVSQELRFKGKDSPDFYGLSLESNTGVLVDNFGLRGSSGTFFNQLNPTQLKAFFDELNTKLIILQFGGNGLPAIKQASDAANFGTYIRTQILAIQKLAPNASILVIGPADMSVKEGTDYVTHPQLEDLRDAIRKAAFDTGCAFFDMYDCMGGKNSMVTWVDEGIAAKDYIHFSSAGARKIATLLYSALIHDYTAYLTTN